MRSAGCFVSRLHALVAEHAPAAWAELPAGQVVGQVIVGIETDRRASRTTPRAPATRER
jgi:hypothetical protein